MAKHPFRHPRISETHEKLLRKFLKLQPEQVEKEKDSFYKKFRESEAGRYKEASGFHCCYCGEKRDRLDLDHFYPKGIPKHQHPKSPLLEYYRCLAGEIKKYRLPEREDNFFINHEYPKTHARLCIEPTNIIPACPDCNTGGKNIRDFADRPHKSGKLDRFPVEINNPDSPLLLHPGDNGINWKTLLNYFDFIDLAGLRPPESLQWSGTIRSTIVLPRFDESKPEIETLKAATAIDIFGLNRKTLSEQRFRMRQIFLGILHGTANSAKAATDNPKNPIEFIAENLPLHAAAFTIRAFICENPHKLALLDVLREWLGDHFHDIEDLDQFMLPIQ